MYTYMYHTYYPPREAWLERKRIKEHELREKAHYSLIVAVVGVVVVVLLLLLLHIIISSSSSSDSNNDKGTDRYANIA